MTFPKVEPNANCSRSTIAIEIGKGQSNRYFRNPALILPLDVYESCNIREVNRDLRQDLSSRMTVSTRMKLKGGNCSVPFCSKRSNEMLDLVEGRNVLTRASQLLSMIANDRYSVSDIKRQRNRGIRHPNKNKNRPQTAPSSTNMSLQGSKFHMKAINSNTEKECERVECKTEIHEIQNVIDSLRNILNPVNPEDQKNLNEIMENNILREVSFAK